MFQFPRFPLPALCVQTGVTRHDPCQVFPFGHPRIKACLAAPRGLSQPATSFIGFQRLGIHRVPLHTCRDDARARYGVLKDHPGPGTGPRSRRSVTFKAAQCARHPNAHPAAVMTPERDSPTTRRAPKVTISQ
jgi:hypothetical protein